jgi:hypothetical protein
MNYEQVALAGAAGLIHRAPQLIHRLGHGLPGVRDVYLPHANIP